jgi:hypothetical protein
MIGRAPRRDAVSGTRPLRRAAPAIVWSMLLAACGTAVFDHVVEVQVSDPSGRLGAGPIEVSVFDKQMGQSAEWARRTMGVARPGAPYVGRVSSTAAKMIYDHSPPAQLEVGLALPAYESRGYFLLSLPPSTDQEHKASAPFIPYGAYFADPGSPAPPLPLRVRTTAARKGWRLHVTVDVPAVSQSAIRQPGR